MSNERIQGFYIRNPIYTKTISDNLKIELPYCRVSERKIINSITFLQKLNFCTNTKYANTMNVLFHFLNGTLFYFILIHTISSIPLSLEFHQSLLLGSTGFSAKSFLF